MASVSALSSGEHRIICGPGPSTESSPVIILERLLDFRTAVHDKWAVLYDRLANGPTLQKKELRLLIAV
jgi:hypothetical protein